MRFLVSPCAYKGTLSAPELARAMADAVRRAQPDAFVEIAPIADGGDGTLDAIRAAIGGEVRSLSVEGPVDNPVTARWLALLNDSAVVELACASGLVLLPGGKLRPLDAHTFGLGQVIRNCLEYSPNQLFVCVGGSASTDGGAGVLSALGARFLDARSEPVAQGGRHLDKIQICQLDQLNELLQLHPIPIKVAVDVSNPLLGEHGAAKTYAPQKGATEADVVLLDRCLEHFADVLEKATGRKIRDLPGSGAAGGTAFGIAAATGGELVSGFNWLAELMNLERKISQSDIVITGEGKLDHQSLSGKAIGELSKLCSKHRKPLWAFPAIMESGLDWSKHGIGSVVSTAVDGQPADIKAVSDAVYKAFVQTSRAK